MRGSAAKLERLRRLAASDGVPLDALDRLTLSPRRVARLLDVSLRTIEYELEEGKLATTYVRGARRIAVLDLVEYLEANRRGGVQPKATEPDEVVELVERFG